MSLESFIGMDAGEGMSEAAFEAFKEKMKKAAAQIAAAQKEEKKQKKKEEELLKILLRFIKKSQKKDLVLLISRVLEQNIPANFVLAVILLGNEEIQREVGDYLMLKGEVDEKDDEKALVFFGQEDETLPLKIKIRLDDWVKDILFQAGEKPQKLLGTAYQIEMIESQKESKSIKVALIQLVAFVLREFLEQNEISEPYEKLSKFAKFILRGILTKTQESIDERGLLEDEKT